MKDALFKIYCKYAYKVSVNFKIENTSAIV